MGEKEKEEKDKNKPRKFESLSPKPIDQDSVSIYLEALKEGLLMCISFNFLILSA